MSGKPHRAVTVYRDALPAVAAAGYASEIDWQRSRDESTFSESDLLRETAWVILCSGFRESVVRKKFDYVSLCFCDWSSAEDILENETVCRRAALSSFANRPKIDAIVSTAAIVTISGFPSLRARIRHDPIRTLQRFDFIGGVTALHLAKNLGFFVAKPDRHLVRLSQRLGFASTQDLCECLARETGDPVNVVDVTLWRYCTLAAPGVEDRRSN